MGNNDLIRRSDVLELMEVDFRYEQCNQVSDYVENIPAVDAVPVVHGRWVSSGLGVKFINCSVCGKQRFQIDATNFCPNCGARMDGKKVGE